jgi:hypothetical protein
MSDYVIYGVIYRMSYITGTIEDFTSRLHQGATGVPELSSFVSEGDVYIQSGTGVVPVQLRNKWEREAQLHAYSYSNTGTSFVTQFFDVASGFWSPTSPSSHDGFSISGPNNNTLDIFNMSEGAGTSWLTPIGKRLYFNLNQTFSATGSWILTNGVGIDSYDGTSLYFGVLSGDLNTFVRLGTGIFSALSGNASGNFIISALNNRFSGMAVFESSISGSQATAQTTIILSGFSIV